MVAFVLLVVAFVLMVAATVINFAKEGGGTSAYLTLAASVLLAVAVVVSLLRWSRSV
jgi:hypothetical protein